MLSKVISDGKCYIFGVYNFISKVALDLKSNGIAVLPTHNFEDVSNRYPVAQTQLYEPTVLTHCCPPVQLL